MAEKPSVSINDGWNGFWIMIAITAVAFYGEPDLVDAIKCKLTGNVAMCEGKEK